MEPRRLFAGAQIEREPRFEAHLFALVAGVDQERVREIVHEHGFRISSRPRVARDGSLDLLITKNGNDRSQVEYELRQIADTFVRAGYRAYRIRLEEMIFDELERSSKAPLQ